MVRPVVHSTKHYVQYPIDEITTGTSQQIILIEAVQSTVANLATEVEEGALVKAVFVELWLQNQGTLSEVIVNVTKTPAQTLGPNFVQAASLFTYVNKKNIFFTHQGLTPNDGVSGPIAPIRHWVKIPKSKQRFGLGDRLVLSIANVSANDLNRCGMATYKEYT